MSKMRTVDAAVAILEKEGAIEAFGLPGAAINPFYSAMRAHGGIRHTLARHVEGASHMADGFSRAQDGNIGICIGTSGPAGTDMITGLYAAWADSIPMLCITGQAPVAKLHKEDFQAVDIESIAKPVTKMAMTVLEPGQVPGAFQKAFQLMRSGRPGPVLLDLPIDVQLAEIEFDIDTYEPLPVEKPKASRKQLEKALDMLTAARHPLIVAGGGIINAGASAQLVELAETLNIPVIPTLMGWGTIPDDHRLMAGMVGLQTSPPLRQRELPAERLRDRHRQPLGQPPHRRPGHLHGRPQVRAHRHRAHADRPRVLAGPGHRVRRRRGAGWPG
jgi:tartronate-semialdehyde synthase